ncbi:PREDICTED: uncharacterized protein LOC104820723 isoform X2 [Tarenaya hassleriana]|uniref:uncharacterized protein LOC104820723 isoform X2 n=1 Tax=Tarenaya hassleriana TaxID=28532 RepID=UPI00053C2AC2|nr:PREDICTED: uncharacterized protein LOC104820723 isoform X2 [Tarenaya hassleriana]
MWWWSSTKGRSNLERFLRGITPRPPSFSLPPRCVSDVNRLWNQQGKEDELEYFRLSDVWDCYDELSAYGLGSHVELNNGESVTQYYVPYLSAIQIYTRKSSSISRNHMDTVESESECWSDDSCSEKLSRSLSNDSNKTWDAVSEDSCFDHVHDTASLMRDRLGYLEFSYFETAPPHLRVPFTDKINQLAEKCPGLLSLRSIDISPASWMAVAWYPIYHIPSRKNEKDLSACFLSYHTLSSSFQDNLIEAEDDKTEEGTSCCLDESTGKRIPLAPFGLSTYKMQQGGELWAKPGTYDHERLLYLNSAADSWLKQLNVYHHDYSFFTVNSVS